MSTDLCGDLPVAAVEIGGDRGPLGTEAQPGFALAAVTDPVVADEFSAVCGHGRTGCPGGRGLALDGGACEAAQTMSAAPADTIRAFK